jgi:hypothetical protein
MERREERAGSNGEGPLRDLLDPPGDSEPVVGPEPQRLQDQQIEGTAKEVGFFSQAFSYRVSI